MICRSGWLQVLTIVFAGISLAAYAAEGPIASVQRSLKDQQFYFGEVNGQMDEETKASLRRYQIHRGLTVSGELDTATLQALQSSTEGTDTNASGAPSEPVAERSVRGRARNLMQDDREFLEQLEGTEKSTASTAEPLGSPLNTPSRIRETKRTPPSPPISERSEPSRREQVEPPGPKRVAKPDGFNPADAIRFVEDYLEAAEQPTPEEEVSFFADRVDYFDSGKVSRQFIEKDQRNYYRRWTSRNFELLGEPKVIRSSEDSATIQFRVRYALRGAKDSSQGEVEEIVRLQRTGDGWKIAAIRERKRPD